MLSLLWSDIEPFLDEITLEVKINLSTGHYFDWLGASREWIISCIGPVNDPTKTGHFDDATMKSPWFTAKLHTAMAGVP